MKTILLLGISSIIVLFIIIIIEKLRFSYTNKMYTNVVNQELCETIIEKSNNYTFKTYAEPVDSKKVYQIDVFEHRKIENPILWKYVKQIYDDSIYPLLQQSYLTYNIFTKLKISWVFIRRYNTFERDDLSIHNDENRITVNVLLSDTNKYTGGEFYIFDKKTSNKYISYYHNVLQHDEEKKKEFIQSFPNLPILSMKQGDIIIYSGEHHLHGVLPMKSGTRYIISYFLD